jgi:hypothetical protein
MVPTVLGPFGVMSSVTGCSPISSGSSVSTENPVGLMSAKSGLCDGFWVSTI